jgi:pyridoxal phosphate enzyme (YggS family)
MSVSQNLARIREEVSAHVKIVAVSKMMPVDRIMEAYQAGQRLFGENKMQEITDKHPLLPGDIRWHFIGHLQTNKVKYIAPFVDMIESVDSLKLLAEINKQAEKNNRRIKCLIQFHIATEESKFGLDLAEADALLNSLEYKEMRNVVICGVMGMASFIDDLTQVRNEFRNLKDIFNHLKMNYFSDIPAFCEISMGMTGDYAIAIEEGSTIVRIGTGIFGRVLSFEF